MKSSQSAARKLLNSKTGSVAILLLLGLILWRSILFVFSAQLSSTDYDLQVWSASYQILAFWGVVCGLSFSKRWGGWKSIIGRANIMFALGLCGQLLGQTISSYYFYQGSSLPYPSLGDVGFFASIPLYTYGAYLLAHASGAKISARTFLNKIQIVLVPVIMLSISSYFFLGGYEFDWQNPLKVFLDFGYPLGDAIYISMAILAFSLSWRMLGGIMRTAILSFIIALVIQYVADFSFLYVNSQETYLVGGITDFMYMLSYFTMALSLIQLAVSYERIKNS